MSDELRINATDLSRLIGERDDYERAHTELLEKTKQLDQEWRAERDEYREQLHRFHRAVQEELGWDQAVLLPEGQLLGRIRYLVAAFPAVQAADRRLVALEDITVDVDAQFVGEGALWPAGGPDGTVLVEHPAAHSAPTSAEQAWVENTPEDGSPFTALMQPDTRVQWVWGQTGQLQRGTVISHNAPGDSYVHGTMALVHMDNGQDVAVQVRRLRPEDTAVDDEPGPPTEAMEPVGGEPPADAAWLNSTPWDDDPPAPHPGMQPVTEPSPEQP